VQTIKPLLITIGNDGRISNVSTANIDTTTANPLRLQEQNAAVQSSKYCESYSVNIVYIIPNSAYDQANIASANVNIVYNIVIQRIS
jgi:hypothetical protein